ncbi:MAG: phosphopantothenate/pantothenate synthetase [Candidatus Lokiarchaeota archaeon]|nr:phosphopantothenate/pantothenate synthetase [Candidatus Lokiarchaeota archaeon]
MNTDKVVPDDHPRKESLDIRERIIEGHDDNIVATAGLLAHGRGEAFDYLIGERTTPSARQAAKAAVAALHLAEKPVISVNGNVCALVPVELVELSEITGAPLEINLFYYRREREEAMLKMLKKAGAQQVLGTHDRPSEKIPELSSNRRKVDSEGIAVADTVLVPLEDGDRTEALRRLGKRVITIDLNPMSRTAINSNITVVDNIIRAMPVMVDLARDLKSYTSEKLTKALDSFDNKKNLRIAIQDIMNHLREMADAGIMKDVTAEKEAST